MLKLKDSIQVFDAHLKKRNYSRQTQRVYGNLLNQYTGYLIQKGLEFVTDITKSEIRKYLKSRYYHVNFKGKQNRASTRNREITCLKSYFKFLYQSEYLPMNLGEEIEYIKGPQLVLPKDILTRQELLKLFSASDISTTRGYRDRMIFEILYATGMRRAELCALKPKDINFTEQTVHIREGKGKKDRVVPICDTALKFIDHYLKYIRPDLKVRKYKQAQDEELILSVKGKSIEANKLNDLLALHIKNARLKKKISLHSIRHTVATHLLQKGMPLRHLQELLGHEKLDSTIRYLNLNMKDIQREYKKYHPRERDDN